MARRVVLIVPGVVLLVIGARAAIGGGALMALFGSSDTLSSGVQQVSTPTRALVSRAGLIQGASGVQTVVGSVRLRITATPAGAGHQLVVGIGAKLSARMVHDTTAKLTAKISAKGMKLFAVIYEAAEARQVGLTLLETALVIFGSPEAGTPVMGASPLSAPDLPLKVLIWADEGQTKVSDCAPAALAASHHLTAGLAANLAGGNALTDALAAA